MKNELLPVIKEIIRSTSSGQVQWSEIEGSFCLTGMYSSKNIIICKYTFPDNNKSVASFNFLDENNDIIGTINEWNEDEDGYEIVYNLFCKASSDLKIDI